jgi:surface antigen
VKARTLLLAAMLAGLASSALADDDRRRGDRKEEFWDGPCKVEIEWKKNGDYKQERKCQGQGDRYRERKSAFWDGPCRVEREWKKNGDFKEERKCDGRRGHDDDDHGRRSRPRPVVVAPAPVYPPWVVVERGEPVYRPGREPAPPRGSVHQCRSEAVGRVIGGVAGAVIGSQIGKDGGARTATTIGGTVIGILIGGEIGRRIDQDNQACIAHALEFGAVGQRVAWAADATQYAVVPGRAAPRGSTHCRPYEVEVLTESGWRRSKATACRRPDGVWIAG